VYPRKPTAPPYRKPQSCRGCPLQTQGQGFGWPDGDGSNGMLIVGEALGETEARKGEFFAGIAGWQLDILLRRAGIHRDQCTIENIVHCRPPKNRLVGMPYEKTAIQRCQHFLDATIDRVQPKVILTLGNLPMRVLTGNSGISRHRGFIGEDNVHGIPVVPTYHPSFLLPRRKSKSSAKWTGPVVYDIKKALRIAKEGFTKLRTNYVLNPTPERADQFAQEFLDSDAEWLSWDIETPYKMEAQDETKLEQIIDTTILRISFAFRPGYSITMPWFPDYLPAIRRMLESGRKQIGWNIKAFDIPQVQAVGVFPKGDIHDGMNAWHVLQPYLPRGLEFVSSFFCDHLHPWKHLSKDEPKFYSCVDADAALVNMLGIMEAMKAQDVV